MASHPRYSPTIWKMLKFSVTPNAMYATPSGTHPPRKSNNPLPAISTVYVERLLSSFMSLALMKTDEKITQEIVPLLCNKALLKANKKDVNDIVKNSRQFLAPKVVETMPFINHCAVRYP